MMEGPPPPLDTAAGPSASAVVGGIPSPPGPDSRVARACRTVLANFLRSVRAYELMPESGKVRRCSQHTPPSLPQSPPPLMATIEPSSAVLPNALRETVAPALLATSRN